MFTCVAIDLENRQISRPLKQTAAKCCCLPIFLLPSHSFYGTVALKISRKMPPSAGQKRPRHKESGDEQQDGTFEAFEAAPRHAKAEWLDNGAARLPVKLADGTIKQPGGRPVFARKSEEEESDDENDSDDNAAEDGDASEASDNDEESDDDDGERGGANDRRDNSKQQKHRKDRDRNSAADPMTAALGYAELVKLPLPQLQARRVAQQARIADLAEKIISHPEHNLAAPAAGKEKLQFGKPGVGRTLVSKKANTLLQLHTLCGDGDPVVRRLAMLSCVAVFKDIVPSYRVRQTGPGGSDGERGVKLKKEVKKLRDFEQALLAGYQRFLRYLEFTVVEGERAERRMKRRVARGGSASGSASAGAAGGDVDDGASVVSDGPVAADGFDDDAYVEGGYKDDDGAEATDKTGGKKPRLPAKEFSLNRMGEKRSAKAARDQTVAYEGDDETKSALGLEALRCMSELLSSLHHFNFRSNLIHFLVPRTCAHSDAAAAVACGALGDLFSNDTGLEATTEAIRALQDAVKSAASRPGGLHKIRPEAIGTLQKLRLGILERSDRERRGGANDGGKHGKKGGFMGGMGSKKTGPAVANAGGSGGGGGGNSKDPYDRDDVMAGLKAADAEALGERQANAKSALRAAIGVYFRVLRAPGGHSAGAHLLGPVLSGLSRIAHLIDVGVVTDLLAALKGLLAASTGLDVEELINAGEDAGADVSSGGGGGGAKRKLLPVPVAFNAVLSALRVMSGPGELLNADETEFAHFLYGSLLRLASSPAGYEHTLVAVHAVQALLIHRREVSNERVAAFVKRLLLVALSVPPHATLALLSLVRSLLHRYGAVARALLGPPTEAGHATFAVPPLFAASAAGGSDGGASNSKVGKTKGGSNNNSSSNNSSSSSSAASSLNDMGTGLKADVLSGLVSGSRGAVFDSDRALAMANTAWELGLLTSHYHPVVAAFATAAAAMAPLPPSDSPDALFARYKELITGNGDTVPAAPAPKRQPYQIALQQQQQSQQASAVAAAAAEGQTLSRKERRKLRAKSKLYFVRLPGDTAPGEGSSSSSSSSSSTSGSTAGQWGPTVTPALWLQEAVAAVPQLKGEIDAVKAAGAGFVSGSGSAGSGATVAEEGSGALEAACEHHFAARQAALSQRAEEVMGRIAKMRASFRPALAAAPGKAKRK